MHRSFFAAGAFAALVFAIATADAGTIPGEPNSSERHAYCEPMQTTCSKQGAASCTSDSSPTCLQDVQEQCSKDYTRCMEEPAAPSPPPAPPSAPTVTPTSCNDLFNNARAFVGAHPIQGVSVLWTTNYLAHGE